jgi:hypothetical protein
MRRLLVTAAALAACGLTGGAGATGAKEYVLARGDVARINGTNLTCLVTSKKAFACFLLNAKDNPIPRSYGVLVGPAYVELFRVNSKGSFDLVAKKNQPGARVVRAAVTRSSKTYSPGVGDRLHIAETGLWCKVYKLNAIAVECFKLSSRLKPIAGTYGGELDHGQAVLFRATSNEGSGNFKVVLRKIHLK